MGVLLYVADNQNKRAREASRTTVLATDVNTDTNVHTGSEARSTTEQQSSVSTVATKGPKPEVHIVRNIEYYNIYGDSSDELLQEISTKGPQIGEGVYHAAVLPKTYFDLPCNGTPQVTLEITYYYPQWIRPGNVDPTTASEWNTYLYVLDAHEQGHEDIALAAAQKTLDALYEIPFNTNCDTQLQEAKDVAGRIVDEGHLQNLNYDRVTNHGQTQLTEYLQSL